MPRLIITRESQPSGEIDFETDLRIGRDPTNDLPLEDPGRGVSRFHAEIRRTGAGYLIADLESRNGTWVDDQRVPKLPLVSGMKIALGPYVLEFQDAAAPAGHAPAYSSPYTVYDPPRAARMAAPPPPPPPVRAPQAGGVSLARRRQAQ